MRVFVSNASLISKVQNCKLREFMGIGSCLRTPLEKKCTFDWKWSNTAGRDHVSKVIVYMPGLNSPHCEFEVDINLSDWYRMTLSVNEYQLWKEDNEEADRVRNIIKALEEAAKVHGARQATVANGFISDAESFLRESGKILKEARAAVYKEFDV